MVETPKTVSVSVRQVLYHRPHIPVKQCEELRSSECQVEKRDEGGNTHQSMGQ